nr:ras-related protein Rab-39B-like [Biomphalaria glabrata]
MCDPIFEYQFRLILIGDSTVGKSSLLRYFTDGNSTNLVTQLSITRSYYRNSVGVMIVYDISKRSSFENLKTWYEEAREHIEPHKAIFVILGHKADNEEKRQVTFREGKRFAEMHGLKFFETSAKSGQNVEESFASIAKDTYQHLLDGHIKIEEGWDGVKAGFAKPKETVQLVEAETESRCC